MKLIFQRTLDRALGEPLCRILSLLPWRYRKVPFGFTPRNILVICLSEMGSLILAKPMFDRVREKYPSAAVHLLLFERNKGVLKVLDLVPENHLLTLDDGSFRKFVADSIRVVSRLRRLKIDTVLDCELFSRISSLFSLSSGAKVRAGFHAHTQEGLYRGGFINRPLLYNPYRHISLQFISMVKSLGAQGMPLVKAGGAEAWPEVAGPLKDPKEKQHFYERLQEDFPQLIGKKLVLLYPGGGLLPIRAWPREHYCRVAADMTARGFGVAVIGLPEDKTLAEKIRLSCRSEGCVDLTGYTKNIQELVFLLEKAALLISNDGGPGHFTSLMNIPAIVFYGPETPILYGVLNRNAHLLHSPLPCSPCLTAYNHRSSPCDGNNRCLRSISPDIVLKKAYELIAAVPEIAGVTNAPRNRLPHIIEQVFRAGASDEIGF